MSRPTKSQEINPFADLIANLGDNDGLVRQRARLMLVHLGRETIPSLLEALESDNSYTRMEAVKALGEFQDPSTAAALPALLMDDDAGVRWSAAEGLIHQGRSSLRPLFEFFIHHFDSSRLRSGLHHILHVFKDRNLLKENEMSVFTKLDQQDFSGLRNSWTGDVAWAVEKALEVIDRESRAAQ